MIISYPTGFYATVLPKDPTDPTSVTYTISNSPPPRAALNFVQLPYASGLNGKSWNNQLKLRDAFGELAHTTAEVRQWNPVDGFKLTDNGQILEFGDEAIVDSSPKVGPTLNVRHNSTALDLERIGVQNDSIKESLRVAYDKAVTDLNNTRAAKAKIDTDISTLRSKITDATKAKTAVLVAGLTEVAANIQLTIDGFTTSINAKILESNALTIAANKLVDNINSLGLLVK